MTRVYWSAVDARCRTVYTCRILPADDVSASKSCREKPRCADDGAQEDSCGTTSVLNSDTVPAGECSVTRTSDFGTTVDDVGTGGTDQLDSHESDNNSSTMQHLSGLADLLTTDNKNTPESTECESHRHSTTVGNTSQCRTENICSNAPSRHTSNDSSTVPHLVNEQEQHRHKECEDNPLADTKGKVNGDVHLFQPNFPAFECIPQCCPFGDTDALGVSDKIDSDGDNTAESGVCAGGLRSEFDSHKQLKCAPLKLISQLDGAITDSESDPSEEEADIPSSCDDVLSRSLMAPLCHPFAADQGASGPFKCLKCKRIYRTEESCAVHSAVCTFELSSSSDSDVSDSEKSDYDNEDYALDHSVENTDSCEGDDGLVSHYLTSSLQNNETVANCSSIGCQTEHILMATEDCDMNANCKILCHSNMDVEHFRSETTEESCSVRKRIENKVDGETGEVFAELCMEMSRHSPSTLMETVVTCSASCVADSTWPGADVVSTQTDKNGDKTVHSFSNVVVSGERVMKSVCIQHQNSAAEPMESHTVCEQSAYGVESVQCCNGSLPRSEASFDDANSTEDVQYSSMSSAKAALHPSGLSHNESNASDRGDAIDQRVTALSGAAFSAAISAMLAEEQKSPLMFSSVTPSTAVFSTSPDTAEQFNRTACSPATCFPGNLTAALRTLPSSTNTGFLGHITSSSVASMSSQQFCGKPQDMPSSSASMVWPSVTMLPTAVNRSSVMSSRGMYTQLLAAPWVPVAVLTTSSVVIPTAVPNDAAAAWIRPLSTQQPLYAFDQSRIQSPSFSQPVQLFQQFLRPALIAPVTWLAPQLAVMNGVNVYQLLTPRPAVRSSPTASSHQMMSPTSATKIISTSQQPALTTCQTTVSNHNSLLAHQVASSTADDNVRLSDQMTTAVCPQISGFRFPASSVSSVSRSAGSVQSVSQMTDCMSNRSINLSFLPIHPSLQSVIRTTVASQKSLPSPPVGPARAQLSSASLHSNSRFVNQLQDKCHSLALFTDRDSSSALSSLSTLSRYIVSCGNLCRIQSTGTLPASVNCLSTSSHDHQVNVPTTFSMPGKCDLQTVVTRTEANVNVVPLSQHVVSSGSTSLTWSTGTTSSASVNSLSRNGCEYKEKTSAGLRKSGSYDLLATVARTVARISVDVVQVPGRLSFSMQESQKVNGLLPLHTDTSSRAHCVDLMARHGTSAISSSFDAAFILQPCHATPSAPLLPLPVSNMMASGCSARMNSCSTRTVSVAGNGFPIVANGARSPRLVIQPSLVAANTGSEALMNLAQSVLKFRPHMAANLPSVTTSLPCVPARSDTQSCTSKVSTEMSSSVHSGLAENILNSSLSRCAAQLNRPFPLIESDSECLTDSVSQQHIFSPETDAVMTSSAGK